MGLQRPFFIGDLKLSSNVFCAPLAGCSDYPFRKMLLNERPGLFFCEMVHINALVRHDPNTYKLLDYSHDMHPIGAQLCGSTPHIAKEAAKIVEDLGFDLIDLNCGCPVDKVVKDGSGSGMLKMPERIAETLQAIIQAVKVPVTVKIRAGWDEESIIATKVTELAEAVGAKAITIHGRTREQGYSGFANREHIKACKEVAKKIKVIGNGDIFDPKSAEHMFEFTGCDGILISRGSFGKPWIFEDIYHYLETKELKSRSLHEIKAHFFKHFDIIASYAKERKALLDLRRVGCWYLKHLVGAKPLKESLHKCQTIDDVRRLFDSPFWEETSIVTGN